jgi:hypothetical protein
VRDNVTTAERYREKADECVTLAKSAISNEVRALHYGMAQRYLRLAEDEMKKIDAMPTRDRVRASARRPTTSRTHQVPLANSARTAYGKAS